MDLFIWFGLLGGIAIILLAAVVLIFEIWMFFDIIENQQITTDRKWLWALGMIFIHPFVAIVYYFTDHQKRIRPPKNTPTA